MDASKKSGSLAILIAVLGGGSKIAGAFLKFATLISELNNTFHESGAIMISEFWAEIERRDVVFRRSFTSATRSSKPPFAVAASDYQQELDAVIEQLESGDISLADALTKGTEIMESYYGEKYPLSDGPNQPTNKNTDQ